jgi:hypothetical protein
MNTKNIILSTLLVTASFSTPVVLADDPDKANHDARCAVQVLGYSH